MDDCRRQFDEWIKWQDIDASQRMAAWAAWHAAWTLAKAEGEMKCSQDLRREGKSYPRTCAVHGLYCPRENVEADYLRSAMQYLDDVEALIDGKATRSYSDNQAIKCRMKAMCQILDEQALTAEGEA